MLITLSFCIGCYMRDYISLSMLLHIKDFLKINMHHSIQLKKCLFPIVLAIFSSILNIECLFARAEAEADTLCHFCRHPSRCQICAHTFIKGESLRIDEDESENLTKSDSKRSNSYLHMSLDGISFEKKSAVETGDEDDESQNEEDFAQDEKENTDDEESTDIEKDDENNSDADAEDLSEDESEEDNDVDTLGNSEDENALEGENLEEEQEKTQSPEESDTLDNPSEDLDVPLQSTNDLTMPDTDSSGDISVAGADNYQEIVQDVIEYFKELGVLDETKLSQLSRGLKNGICMACRANRLVHVIPGKKVYNICSNCFECMINGFIARGSGYTLTSNPGVGATGGMYPGVSGNSYSNMQGVNGSNFNADGNQYVNGQGMNGMPGQNNTADAASGIVGAALGSIPGMNGQLKSALSSGISSLLHKDSADSGANSASGTTMPVMGMVVGADGLPVTAFTPSPQGSGTNIVAAGQPMVAAGASENQMVFNALGQLVPMSSLVGTSAPYGYVKNPNGTFSPAISAAQGLAAVNSTAAATASNQMVLNALGQLVPMSSLAGTFAPYGYVKNPDGTYSPATSEAQGLAAGAAANNTSTSKLDNTLNKINTSVNKAVSTANTIATVATPIAGLASNLAATVSNLKTAKTTQNSSATSSNSKTQQEASSSEQTTPEKEKQLKKRSSENSTAPTQTPTKEKKLKKRRKSIT